MWENVSNELFHFNGISSWTDSYLASAQLLLKFEKSYSESGALFHSLWHLVPLPYIVQSSFWGEEWKKLRQNLPWSYRTRQRIPWEVMKYGSLLSSFSPWARFWALTPWLLRLCRHQNQWHRWLIQLPLNHIRNTSNWKCPNSTHSLSYRAYTDSCSELSRTDECSFRWKGSFTPKSHWPPSVFLAFCLLFPLKELNPVSSFATFTLQKTES